jgi:hypothetical protein
MRVAVENLHALFKISPPAAVPLQPTRTFLSTCTENNTLMVQSLSDEVFGQASAQILSTQSHVFRVHEEGAQSKRVTYPSFNLTMTVLPGTYLTPVVVASAYPRASVRYT